MRHDGAADFVGVSALFENLIALVRMLFGSRPALVVEIVNQADDGPQIFVVGEPLPNLRAQARMQASTASACFRKLSD